MGLPANVSFEVGELPAEVPAIDFGGAVDELIAKALGRRPDLAAAREAWLASKADVTAARGAWLPQLDLTGSVNRNYYDPQTLRWSSSRHLVRRRRCCGFRSGNGLRNKYEVAQAQRGRRARGGRRPARSSSRSSIRCGRAGTTSRPPPSASRRTKDLLDSATESEQVALGRYTRRGRHVARPVDRAVGVGRARAQEIAARADWLVAAARFTYSTGGLTGVEALPR